MDFVGVLWCAAFFCSVLGDPTAHQTTCSTTRLHEAVQKRDSTLLNDALKNEKDFYVKDCKGMTPMDLALESGYVQGAYKLLENSYDLDTADSEGDTILIRAVRRGIVDEVRNLVEFGSSVDFVNLQSSTPLLEALLYGKDLIVKLLLEAGAELDLELPGGNRYLHRIVDLGNFGGALKLLKLKVRLDPYNDKYETPLTRAVLKDNAAFVNLLASRGADVKRSNRLNTAYLHLAAKENSIKVIPALIRHGIKVDKEINSGDTALLYAVQQNNTKAVRILLDSGADLNYLNEKGDSYLHTAGQNTKLLRQFLDLGVQPDIADKHGKTLMHSAVEWDDTKVMGILHEHGSDLNQTARTFFQSPDKVNTTLLHLAAISGSPNAVEWLVRHGAPINARTHTFTPLDAAINVDEEKSALKLVELGACDDFEANDCQRSYKLALVRDIEAVAKSIQEKKLKST